VEDDQALHEPSLLLSSLDRLDNGLPLLLFLEESFDGLQGLQGQTAHVRVAVIEELDQGLDELGIGGHAYAFEELGVFLSLGRRKEPLVEIGALGFLQFKEPFHGVDLDWWVIESLQEDFGIIGAITGVKLQAPFAELPPRTLLESAQDLVLLA